MSTSPTERSLADWLDAPVATLRARRRALMPTVSAGLVILIATTVTGQALTLVSSDLESLSTGSLVLFVVATFVGSIAMGVLITLAEMVCAAGVFEVEERRPAKMADVFAIALRRPMITAALVRLLFHVSMAILTLATCGLGLVAWLMAFLYIPLVFPVALREETGGLKALLRSVDLVSWKPAGGPWYGSVDRVVVAYHVVAGIAYALWALPSLPSLAWMGVTTWELIMSGTFDPLTVQEQLVPPVWLSVPAQVASHAMGLLATLYSQQLYLDLHRDLRDAREGLDLQRALDRLGAPTNDA